MSTVADGREELETTGKGGYRRGSTPPPPPPPIEDDTNYANSNGDHHTRNGSAAAGTKGLTVDAASPVSVGGAFSPSSSVHPPRFHDALSPASAIDSPIATNGNGVVHPHPSAEQVAQEAADNLSGHSHAKPADTVAREGDAQNAHAPWAADAANGVGSHVSAPPALQVLVEAEEAAAASPSSSAPPPPAASPSSSPAPNNNPNHDDDAAAESSTLAPSASDLRRQELTRVDRWGNIRTASQDVDAGKSAEQLAKERRSRSRRLALDQEREAKWVKMVGKWDRTPASKLKRRIRKGIPDSMRGDIWPRLTGANELMRGTGAYAAASSSSSGGAPAKFGPGVYARYAHMTSAEQDTIARDIARTFPKHVLFRDANPLGDPAGTGEGIGGAGQGKAKGDDAEGQNSPGRNALYNVLKAYSLHDEQVGYCFPETDHELLTDHGFKNLAQVLDTKTPLRFATLRQDTGAIEYQTPIRLVVNPHRDDQPMVEFTQTSEARRWNDDATADYANATTVGVSLLVTPEHSMYAARGHRDDVPRHEHAFEKVPATVLLNSTAAATATAADARMHALRFRAAASAGVATASVVEMPFVASLGLVETSIDAFLAIYGLWLGSGASIQHDAIELIAPHDAAAEWMRVRLAQLDLVEENDWSASLETDGSTTFRLVPPTWVRYFETLDAERRRSTDEEATTTTKRFSSWAFGLGRAHVRCMLDGLRHAADDDTANADEEAAFTLRTPCALFRDDLVRLALHAGYTASFDSEMAASEGLEGPTWLVTFESGLLKNDAATPLLDSARGEVRATTYSGRTWCVEVPNGLIFARRAASNNKTGLVTKASRTTITGNCQGMGFPAGLFLMYMTEEEAFWMLHCIARGEKYLLNGMWSPGFPLLLQCFYQFDHLLKRHCPRLHSHLAAQEPAVVPELYAIHWFMTGFSYNLPFDVVLRIWDILLAEGPKIVFRLAIFFMKHLERDLLAANDFAAVMEQLKNVHEHPIMSDPDAIIDGALAVGITRGDLDKLANAYQTKKFQEGQEKQKQRQANGRR